MWKSLTSIVIVCGLMAGYVYAQSPMIVPGSPQHLPPSSSVNFSNLPQSWLLQGVREEWRQIHDIKPLGAQSYYYPSSSYSYPNYYYPQSQCSPHHYNNYNHYYPQTYECYPQKRSWLPYVFGGD